MSPVRLLVVDDHPVVRDGIVGMVASDPEIEVVGEASDGAEAVSLARVLEPDVVLMDLRMRGMDGVAATRRLTSLGVPTRVVILTTFDA
ncbi:MAG TPA: response regulator transcription factor, partial [Nocardioidaceae bacterium]